MNNLKEQPHDSSVNTFGIDKALREAVMQGASSVSFREYIKGVYRALDDMHVAQLIDEDRLFVMKVELVKSMVWLGGKLHEFERDHLS